jgi:phosphoglucosamine mutase
LGRLFGTDGVRGAANKDLTPQLAFFLGRAAAFYLTKGKQGTAVIGRDTRISGPMLEAALVAGVTSTGCDILHAGVIPTPGIAHLTSALGATFGIMISASHNPFADNGIKFFSQGGLKLPDETEDAIEQLVLGFLEGEKDLLPSPTGPGIGRVHKLSDATDRLVEFLVNTTPLDLGGMRIVVDCANGAASFVAPRVYERLGAEVIVLNASPDGININAHCGSTSPEALSQAVIAHKAVLGLAHDGDADRVIAVDERGEIVDGDGIMAICGLDLLKRDKLAKRTLVATMYSNMGLASALRAQGADVLLVENGDRYVWEAMIQHQLNLGGEKSGHIIFSDYNTTGDGILTGIQLLGVINREKKSLSELAGVMESFPQRLINVPVRDKHFAENVVVNEAIAKAKTILGDQGRIFVRASGTEPLIRIMAEAKDEDCLKEAILLVEGAVVAQLGCAS